MFYDMDPIGRLIIAAIVLALIVLLGLLCLVGKLFEALGRFEEYQDDAYGVGEVNHA